MALNKARKRREFLVPLNVEGPTSAELDRVTTDLNFSASHRAWADGTIQYLKRAPAAGAYRPGGKNGQMGAATVLPFKWIALMQEVLKSNSQHGLHKTRGTNPGLLRDCASHGVAPKNVLSIFAPLAGACVDALKEQEARKEVEFVTVTPIAKTLTSPLVESLKSGFARFPYGDVGEAKTLFIPSPLTPDDEIVFEHDGRRIWLRVRGACPPGKMDRIIQQCYQHLAFSCRLPQAC